MRWSCFRRTLGLFLVERCRDEERVLQRLVCADVVDWLSYVDISQNNGVEEVPDENASFQSARDQLERVFRIDHCRGKPKSLVSMTALRRSSQL